MFTSVFPETPKILVHFVMLWQLVVSKSPSNAFPSSRDELLNTGERKRKAFYTALPISVVGIRSKCAPELEQDLHP